MIRKISFLAFSVAILIMGCIGLSKVHFFGKSIRIFNVISASHTSQDQPGKEIREFEKSDVHAIPERRRSRSGEESNYTEQKEDNKENRSYDNNRKLKHGEIDSAGGASLTENSGNVVKQERNDSHEGKKSGIGNTLWFLAIFASFTVITIYVDKTVSYINQKRKEQKTI
jgi:hypothetical protein